jgi:protein tyrosine phosphatase type 4A
VIVAQWIALIDKHTSDPLYGIEKPTIAVHCVAGLGRAPVLVALALLEMGVNPLDAIDFIRQRRRGAFNKLQIHYLDQYKRTTKYRRLSSGSSHSITSSSAFLSWGGRVLSKLTNKGGIHGPQQQEQHYQQSV